MKKITFLFMFFIISLGYAKTNNLVMTGAQPDVLLNGTGTLHNFYLAPCSSSQPMVGAPNGYSISSVDPNRSVADDFMVSANEIFEPDNFTFIVIGNPPTIACPAPIAVNNSTETCGAVVNFAGIAIDVEDGNISGDIVATPASGSTFPVGDTTVTLSVTDSDNNTSTCNFLVTVLDNENPLAVCQNVTVDLDVAGTYMLAPTDIDNGSSDNCGIATYELGMLSGGAFSLTTTFVGGNGASGNMFDLEAVNDLTIDSFDVNMGTGNTADVEIYFKTGTWVGSETTPANWTLIATATGITSAGIGLPTPLNLDLGINVTAGNRVAFYVTRTTGSLIYTNGVTTGALFASDSNLQIFEGAGKGYPFTGTYQPRNFNGNIVYSTSGVITPISGALDCSNIGTNDIYLLITDNSGNTSSCLAAVTVQDVTAPEIFCVGGVATITESEDFEAATVPTGWSTEILAGVDDWVFGSGVMSYGDNFPTNAAIFDDDAAGSGKVNAVRLTSPVYDLTGGSNIMVGYDVAFQEAGTQTFTVEVFDGAAWQQIALYDADLIPNIQTESIDASAYVNAAFQVRWTYDDLGQWGWGAGVDNFLLSYDAVGGGLDVYLDADGMASVDPNDLLTGVNEACGYTITAGGTGGGGSDSLTTLFATNNGGSSGWAVMYDVTVGPADIEVTELDINTSSTTAFTLDLYVLTGTYEGNELNLAAWGSPAASGSGTGAGTDSPSNVVLGAPVMLSANTTYGFAVVTTGVGQSYTNGDGTNQNYSNDDLSIALGSAVSGLFTGSVFTPRIWNGAISYNVVSSGGGLDFTCADLGENLIEVTVTDDSGNASTCFATINVIDNIAPVITCKPGGGGNLVIIELGPDGTTTIDPYDLLLNIEEACGISTIAASIPEVSCADVGTNLMITVFVSDASGNIASCITEVSVVDLLAPVITCPADQTVDPGQGNLFYIVPDYFATGEATAEDNCTDPVTITSQSPVVGAALPEGPHTITLTAEDEYGNVSECSFVLTVKTILGAGENVLDAGLILYPNPASNVVTLMNKTNISLEKMMIYDINGRLVNQINLSTMQGDKAIDVSSLATGVYMVQITGENASSVKRLIKE